MSRDVPRVYFDTSVYVCMMLGPDQPNGDSYEASLIALESAQQGRSEGVVSALVVAEVVGAPALRAPQGLPAEEARRRMAVALEYFERTDFRFIEAARRDGMRAAAIAREFDMKGADALRVALAQAGGSSSLFTLDHDQSKVGERIEGLRIITPTGEAQAIIDIGPSGNS